MDKNTKIALLGGAILALGALAMLTGLRIAMVLGTVIALCAKLLMQIWPQKKIVDKQKQSKQMIWGKVDCAAIVLGCVIYLMVSFLYDLTFTGLSSPTIYYYLGQNDYHHPARSIIWDIIGFDVFSGVIAGYITAVVSRTRSFVNVVIVTILLESLSLATGLGNFKQDPVWFSIIDNALACFFLLAGGIAGMNRENKKDFSQLSEFKTLVPHVIWGVAFLIFIFAIDIQFNQYIQNSPPVALIQQLEEKAQNGNVIAETRLGNIYLLGASKDYTKASAFFCQAAQQGDALAQIMLGRMLFKGQGVEKNDVEAYEWLSISQKNRNDISVESDLAVVRSKLSTNEISAADNKVKEWHPQNESKDLNICPL